MSGDYSRLDDGETTEGTFHRREGTGRSQEPAHINSGQREGLHAEPTETAVSSDGHLELGHW